jgi:hypothetical protein
MILQFMVSHYFLHGFNKSVCVLLGHSFFVGEDFVGTYICTEGQKIDLIH